MTESPATVLHVRECNELPFYGYKVMETLQQSGQ